MDNRKPQLGPIEAAGYLLIKWVMRIIAMCEWALSADCFLAGVSLATFAGDHQTPLAIMTLGLWGTRTGNGFHGQHSQAEERLSGGGRRCVIRSRFTGNQHAVVQVWGKIEPVR